MMRRFYARLREASFGFLFCCFTAPAFAEAGSTNVIFRHHFTGAEALRAQAAGSKFEEALKLPATVEWGDLLLQKLAQAPDALVAGQPNGPRSKAFRGFLEDWLSAESVAELRGSAHKIDEFALAIRLDAVRAEFWRTNWSQVAEAWKIGRARAATLEGFDGWEAGEGAGGLRFVRAGEWVVLSVGPERHLQTEWLKGVREEGRPVAVEKEHFWKARVDWPALRQLFRLPELPVNLEQAEISVHIKDGHLRTLARAFYARPIPWKAQAWQIPTNMIRDPLLSFTAAQPLGAFVKQPGLFTEMEADPLANQFYVWSQSDVPFQTFATFPVQNASRQMQKLSVRLPEVLNGRLKGLEAGEIVWLEERQEIIWKGLPLIVPTLRATNDLGRDYLLASLFPAPKRLDPFPAELLGQILHRTNLVYYDWEITQPRLSHWQVMSQLAPSLLKGAKPGADNAERRTGVMEQKWLSALGALLGNTVTEITMPSPREIEFVRKSHIGLTGVEIVALARAVLQPEFPLFGHQLPGRNTGAADGKSR